MLSVRFNTILTEPSIENSFTGKIERVKVPLHDLPALLIENATKEAIFSKRVERHNKCLKAGAFGYLEWLVTANSYLNQGKFFDLSDE